MVGELPELAKEIPKYERLDKKGKATISREGFWYAAEQSKEIPAWCKCVRKMLCLWTWD